jgi:hypothetical protein
MNDVDKLLKEYIVLLTEEDGGGGGDYGYGGMGGIPAGTWGYMDYGGPLSDIFVKPFVNVFDIAKAGLKELGIRVKTALKVALEVVLTTLIPWLDTDYKKIFNTQREELKRFKQQHAELFKQNLLGFSNDAKLVAFMINPGIYITAGLVRKSPDVAVRMIDTIKDAHVGWVEEWEIIKHRVSLPFDPHAQKLSHRVASRRQTSMFTKRYGKDYYPSDIPMGEAAVPKSAQQQKRQAQSPVDALAAFVKRPDVVKSLENSQVARGFKAEGQRVLNGIASGLNQSISRIMNVRTVADIERLIGKNILNKLTKLQPKERQMVEQEMVEQVRAAAKAFYTKNLTAEIENVKKDGVDANNMYIRTLQGMLSKLGSMR